MILVCTLGGTWQVIPEAYALIAPQRCALYNNHPEQPRKFSSISEPRNNYRHQGIETIALIPQRQQ